jgi:hypothetical protein
MNKTSTSYFSPTKLTIPAEEMARSFANYEAFKKDLSPSASKVDYRHFLTGVQTGKVNYDSNIQNMLEYNKRIIAFKNKE